MVCRNKHKDLQEAGIHTEYRITYLPPIGLELAPFHQKMSVAKVSQGQIPPPFSINLLQR